ncbi:MAG TPA: MmgE/PrpD family protein, partial [Casimicrobiaceae bacterium]|nr:MmgE/PrpD family protein [Casimicrobiaceae bacterium]
MAPRDDSSAAALDALVAWTTSDAAREVPAAVLARAARVLADDASAMIGARDEPEVAAFHARVLARAGRPEATIFRGGRDRT